jgi:type I restriction enzyme S subunit
MGERIRLGDYITWTKGFAFKSEWYGKTGVPVVRVTDFTADSVSIKEVLRISEDNAIGLRRYELQQGDIVIQTVGSWPSPSSSAAVGRVVQVPRQAHGSLLNQNTVRLRSNHRLDQTYLFYRLKSHEFRNYVLGCAHGSGQASVTLDAIFDFSFECPDHATQQRIAGILSAYDDLIENNTRRIAILEEMARALYREWFVEHRFPGHEQVAMVESELGPVPEGWGPKSFSEVASFVNGFAFKPEHWGDFGRPIVKIVELKNGVTEKTPRYAGNDVPSRYDVGNGDLLFSWSADLDVYIWDQGDALLNQHLFNVLPEEGYGRPFLFYALKDQMPEFRSRSQGTTMRHIKRSALTEVKVIVPPKELRSQFDHFVQPILLQVQRLTSKNGQLRATRDLLLPKLISGEVAVDGIDFPMDSPEVAS